MRTAQPHSPRDRHATRYYRFAPNPVNCVFCGTPVSLGTGPNPGVSAEHSTSGGLTSSIATARPGHRRGPRPRDRRVPQTRRRPKPIGRRRAAVHSAFSLFAVGPPWGPCSFVGALRAAIRNRSLPAAHCAVQPPPPARRDPPVLKPVMPSAVEASRRANSAFAVRRPIRNPPFDLAQGAPEHGRGAAIRNILPPPPAPQKRFLHLLVDTGRTPVV